MGLLKICQHVATLLQDPSAPLCVPTATTPSKESLSQGTTVTDGSTLGSSGYPRVGKRFRQIKVGTDNGSSGRRTPQTPSYPPRGSLRVTRCPTAEIKPVPSGVSLLLFDHVLNLPRKNRLLLGAPMTLGLLEFESVSYSSCLNGASTPETRCL